ncbi:hypothetical protein MMC22_010995 [Lobaria immixta]|nr:hypothetical protein [Lobaria immixta]
MQSLSSLALGLGVVLSSVFIASGSRLPISNGQTTRSLASRQAPGVVAPSDFLRRAGHASVVAGDWVYIDGGEFSFMSDGTPQYQYSSTILSIDLSQTWSNSTVTIHSTSKPKGAPDLMNPSLWYHEEEDLLYSGFAGRLSSFGDAPSPAPFSLWSFKPDGTGSGSWTEVIDSGSAVWDSITRPSQSMMAFGSGSAYSLGGFESSQTALSTANLDQNLPVPGLMQFNMKTKKFLNSTAGGYSFNGTAEKGAMHYVPSFGPDGLFIVMGGDDFWHTDPEHLTDLETISIYDPSSEQWFNQTTTGNIPQPRKEFCLAGIESNNATYEIFMYAGWAGHLGAAAIPFDEIYILTLPAFHWIEVYYPPQHPRHGVTCNAVGGSQILTIGGLDTNSKHTVDTLVYTSPYDTTPDPFAQGLAIFDMTSLQFADKYIAKAPQYVQSDTVKFYYDTRPATKFSSPKLAKLIENTHFANATASSANNSSSPSQSDSENSTATPARSTQSSSSNTSHKTSVGAIAGGVVGGVALLLLLGALIFLVRKRSNSREPEHPSYVEVSGESKRLRGQGLQEMYQMPSEMDGNPRQIRVAELRGDGVQSPVELRGEYEPSELNGSVR